MDSGFIVYGRERFLKGKSEGKSKLIQAQLDSLVQYLTSDISYQRGTFHLGPPGLPNCPDCPTCFADTELLGGKIGTPADLTYFIRCKGESSHLFTLRIARNDSVLRPE